MRHAFPFHELLHGIGVDDWTDRVSLVGPRILLFHGLLTPAEKTEKLISAPADRKDGHNVAQANSTHRVRPHLPGAGHLNN